MTPTSDDSRPSEDSSQTDDEKILRELRARFALAEEAEADQRRLHIEDTRFRAGQQWPDDVQSERARDGRPCLTINRIPQFVQQVTNDQRQNRPAIKVHPLDDAADIETGKVIAGMVRHIEYDSNADFAYDTALDSAVTGGYGYFRLTTAHVDAKSFDQEIRFQRVRNPLAVFYDPYSQEPDGSDANWAFVVDDLSEDEYKAMYPSSDLSGMGDWDALGNHAPGWIKKGSCRVAEYFYREWSQETLVQLSDGTTLLEKDLPDPLPIGMDGQPLSLTGAKRSTQVASVKWCKTNGIEILEKTDWLGKWIPIVPVYGTELFVDGKRVLEGVVRNAKDPQRMYNYWSSAETETIALAPRAPFIAAEGQIEGHEEEWKTANRRNHAVLQYKATTVAGVPVGPPTRNVFEPAVQAITQAKAMSADDMKATTGIYDDSLGARSNEVSGIAIQRRNTQSQTSNFHFMDNLSRSIRHGGRIIVDLLPKIYDTKRAIRIIGDDQEQRVIQVNAPFEDQGKQVLYALDVGKYGVSIGIGPSFESKRQEAAAAMLDLTKSWPQLMQLAGDIIVKNMDWSGSDELATRLKKALPPGLADDPKGQQPLPPQVQQQMQQMGQMIDQLTAHLKHKTQLVENKTIELESRERIEMAKISAELEITLANLGSKESIALLTQEMAGIKHRMELLNYASPVGEAQEQDSADQAPGAPGAAGPPAQTPTGGAQSPGSPMES